MTFFSIQSYSLIPLFVEILPVISLDAPLGSLRGTGARADHEGGKPCYRCWENAEQLTHHICQQLILSAS